MSSPNRKRQERLARKRARAQKEHRAFRKRCCPKTEIVNPVCIPGYLRDVTNPAPVIMLDVHPVVRNTLGLQAVLELLQAMELLRR